jgi:hypothetical protein
MALANVCTPYHKTGDISFRANVADGPTVGVAAYDVADNGKGMCFGTPGQILPVTALGAIAAGDIIEVGTGGKARTWATSGEKVGIAITGAADGADAQIKLY